MKQRRPGFGHEKSAENRQEKKLMRMRFSQSVRENQKNTDSLSDKFYQQSAFE